jgi:hypothetical protein
VLAAKKENFQIVREVLLRCGCAPTNRLDVSRDSVFLKMLFVNQSWGYRAAASTQTLGGSLVRRSPFIRE